LTIVQKDFENFKRQISREQQSMLTLVSGAGGNRPSAIHLSSAGRTTFGRAKKPPLATDHHTTLGQDGSDVSRFHASATCQQLPDGAHRWLLKDNNSLNGLLVNHQRVDSDEIVLLKGGDLIAFGGQSPEPVLTCA